MSSFSGRLPDGLQDIGLYLGLLLGIVGVLSVLWYVVAPLFPRLASNNGGSLMPLLELRSIAGKSGWDLPDPSLHLLDLEHALNEAGVRGLVDFYARPVKDHMFDDFIKGEARQLIPREAWQNLEVSGRWIDLHCDDNFEITLIQKEPRYGEKVYVDVHADRAQAKKWLRRDAPEYKGRNHAIHRT